MSERYNEKTGILEKEDFMGLVHLPVRDENGQMTRMGSDGVILESKHGVDWTPRVDSSGHMHRENPDTGKHEVSGHGIAWEPDRDSSGMMTRNNPHDGHEEQSRFGLEWEPKRGSDGNMHRINKWTQVHEVSGSGVFWEAYKGSNAAKSNPNPLVFPARTAGSTSGSGGGYSGGSSGRSSPLASRAGANRSTPKVSGGGASSAGGGSKGITNSQLIAGLVVGTIILAFLTSLSSGSSSKAEQAREAENQERLHAKFKEKERQRNEELRKRPPGPDFYYYLAVLGCTLGAILCYLGLPFEGAERISAFIFGAFVLLPSAVFFGLYHYSWRQDVKEHNESLKREAIYEEARERRRLERLEAPRARAKKEQPVEVSPKHAINSTAPDFEDTQPLQVVPSAVQTPAKGVIQEKREDWVRIIKRGDELK